MDDKETENFITTRLGGFLINIRDLQRDLKEIRENIVTKSDLSEIRSSINEQIKEIKSEIKSDKDQYITLKFDSERNNSFRNSITWMIRIVVTALVTACVATTIAIWFPHNNVEIDSSHMVKVIGTK